MSKTYYIQKKYKHADGSMMRTLFSRWKIIERYETEEDAQWALELLTESDKFNNWEHRIGKRS